MLIPTDMLRMLNMVTAKFKGEKESQISQKVYLESEEEREILGFPPELFFPYTFHSSVLVKTLMRTWAPL